MPFIPQQADFYHTAVFGSHPTEWTGPGAPAASGDFIKAPVGSRYVQKVSSSVAKLWMKVLNAGTAADWVAIGSTYNAKGFLPVRLVDVRESTAGAFGNVAANGNILATDTTPILNTINGDTDGAVRIQWAAGNTDPIIFGVTFPDDLDESSDVLVKFRAAMGGATNTPVLDLDSYFNEGDTKVEDATAAITGTTYTTYTATIAAADVPSDARVLAVEVTPGAHAADALNLTGIWVEYTRR